MSLIVPTLCQRFGPRSDVYRSVLGTNPEKTDLENYYVSILGTLTQFWLGAAFAPVSITLQKKWFEDLQVPVEVQDHFGPLYQILFSAKERQKSGEFYTPNWLVEHLLQQMSCSIGFRDDTEFFQPVLDPCCGSGTFLLAVIRHLKNAGIPNEQMYNLIVGLDKNPIAVLTARTNIALALSSPAKSSLSSQIHIYPFDLLHDDKTTLQQRCSIDWQFSSILGNPPWINWDRFANDQRRSLHEHWQQYGLFNLSAKDARYGGAKKDWAALILLRVVDLFLREGGHLAFVLPRSLFQTRLSGSGFRRFQIGNGSPFRMKRVDDFSTLSVFPGVATKVVTVLLEKGSKTLFPVPYFCWSSPNQATEKIAQPVDANNLQSPWIIQPKTSAKTVLTTDVTQNHSADLNTDVTTDVRSTNPHHQQQQPAYQGYLGANTGGANGIFWVEIQSGDQQTVVIRNNPTLGKRLIPQVNAEIESQLVFPLLRWKDIRAYDYNEPTLGIIIPQNPETRRGLDANVMRVSFPQTLAYLQQFEMILRDRAAFRKYQASAPFYSMYNVGLSLFATYKVIWRRMDSVMRAVPVSSYTHSVLGNRLIIPQETTAFIPCESEDESFYLSALLNSTKIADQISGFCPAGTKGFGSPGLLPYLNLEKFNPNKEEHLFYVETSRKKCLENGLK
ncbi:MAG: N-6 DNA methylase [Thermoguttaceae bacterium]